MNSRERQDGGGTQTGPARQVNPGPELQSHPRRAQEPREHVREAFRPNGSGVGLRRRIAVFVKGHVPNGSRRRRALRDGQRDARAVKRERVRGIVAPKKLLDASQLLV